MDAGTSEQCSVRNMRSKPTLTFKFDESYRSEYVFAVGGALADAEGWRHIHDAIRHSLDFENGQLPPEMRVKRYHAAAMNRLDGEYASWDKEAGRVRERRMTDRLLETLGENAKSGDSCRTRSQGSFSCSLVSRRVIRMFFACNL
jgi:hypothetical protein